MMLVLLALMVGLAACSKERDEKQFFAEAQGYMDSQQWQKAADTFTAMYNKFPNGVFAAKSLFMIGYINANHLNDLEAARQHYATFVEKFPDHELVTAAKYEMDHLGKAPDELPFLMDLENSDSAGEAKGADKN